MISVGTEAHVSVFRNSLMFNKVPLL